MKKITLVYDDWEAEFLVDVAKAKPACKESLDFFSPIDRSEDADLDIVREFIEFWAAQIAEISIHKNIQGVLSEMASIEGCIPLDGTHGITLVSCGSWGWDAGFGSRVIDVKEAA